jgi:hypothetical protein
LSKFTTENNKDIDTFIDPKTALVRIKFCQGGELPASLDGLFTSVHAADQAIISYIAASKPKTKGK